MPLSLEDNSTLSNTGAILDEFGRKFGIPVDSQKEYLPFDKQTKAFCINQAREHCEFISMLKFQKDNINISEHETFEDSDEDETDETMNGKDNLNTREPSSCVTLESVREVFHSHDSLFKSTYDSLHTKVWNAVHSNSMKRLVEDLSQQSGEIINIKDHLGHTLLHEAVEKKDRAFVECLIAVGCNPNVKDDCGVPLTIAVLLDDKDICQQLVSCGASIKEPLFVNVPSPLAVAEKLERTEICEIMQSDSSDDEDEVISSYDTSFRIPYCCVDKRHKRDQSLLRWVHYWCGR